MIIRLLAEQRHGLVLVDGDIDRDVFDDFDLLVAQHFLVDDVFDVLQFLVRDRGEVREVEAQMIRARPATQPASHACPALRAVRPAADASPVWLRMVAWRTPVSTTASTLSPTRIGCFADDLMRPHSLDRVVAALHFGDDGVVIVAVEPSPVANLSAGLGVERRVVEDDLAFFARLEFLRALRRP